MKPTLNALASLAICSGLYAPLAFSDTVTIPLGKQGDVWNVDSPRTGMSKSQVMDKYGEPLSQSGPIGEPPIYSWEYAKFIVYFESDTVIHSVVISK
jgi:hypothetical protein